MVISTHNSDPQLDRQGTYPGSMPVPADPVAGKAMILALSTPISDETVADAGPPAGWQLALLEPAIPDTSWKIDEATRQIGYNGLKNARAALEASRPDRR